MSPKSLEDLPVELLYSVYGHILKLDEASEDTITWARSASVVCKSMALAWKGIKSSPGEHGLLDCLLAIRPHAAAAMILKLGVIDPQTPLKLLAGHANTNDMLLGR